MAEEKSEATPRSEGGLGSELHPVGNMARVVIGTIVVADFEYDLPTGGEPRISEIFYDLVLCIDGDRFSTGEIGEIDAMTTPIEAQFDSVMNETLLLQSVADARLYHQVDGALFEHARAHALLDVFPAAIFDDDRFDAA